MAVLMQATQFIGIHLKLDTQVGFRNTAFFQKFIDDHLGVVIAKREIREILHSRIVFIVVDIDTTGLRTELGLHGKQRRLRRDQRQKTRTKFFGRCDRS